jgi:hypothetical protein
MIPLPLSRVNLGLGPRVCRSCGDRAAMKASRAFAARPEDLRVHYTVDLHEATPWLGGNKYCHVGGTGARSSQRAASPALGVHEGDHGPSSGS